MFFSYFFYRRQFFLFIPDVMLTVLSMHKCRASTCETLIIAECDKKVTKRRGMLDVRRKRAIKLFELSQSIWRSAPFINFQLNSSCSPAVAWREQIKPLSACIKPHVIPLSPATLPRLPFLPIARYLRLMTSTWQGLMLSDPSAQMAFVSIPTTLAD